MKNIRSIRNILIGLKRNITLIEELFTVLTLKYVTPFQNVNLI